jgi:hypothetical protein
MEHRAPSMPARSKVLTLLPPRLRAEVERRIRAKGFSDYRGLAEWLRQQGYHISNDSLWRYGKSLQRKLAVAEMTVYQAHALAEVGACEEGILIDALLTMVQQKLMTKLIGEDGLGYADTRLMNAAANLVRASVLYQRQAEEVHAPKPADELQKRMAQPEATWNAIHDALLRIDPFINGQPPKPILSPGVDVETGGPRPNCDHFADALDSTVPETPSQNTGCDERAPKPRKS